MAAAGLEQDVLQETAEASPLLMAYSTGRRIAKEGTSVEVDTTRHTTEGKAYLL